MTSLVTGSAKGLGSFFSTWLAERGNDVVLHYNKSEKPTQKLKEQLENNFGITCYLWQADFNEPFINSLEDFLQENNLSIDILVNNVGNFLYKPISELQSLDINDVMDTNFGSALQLTQFCIPRMQKNGNGRIINLTCAGSENLVYRKNTAFYHYAKSGVHLLTQLWAAELASDSAKTANQITINSIAPGVLPDSEYKETISEQHWTTYEEVKQALNYILDTMPPVNGVNIDLAKGWKPGIG